VSAPCFWGGEGEAKNKCKSRNSGTTQARQHRNNQDAICGECCGSCCAKLTFVLMFVCLIQNVKGVFLSSVAVTSVSVCETKTLLLYRASTPWHIYRASSGCPAVSEHLRLRFEEKNVRIIRKRSD
ncbi:unnamed protein product, partial [Ectocarpus sp. 12 AP-2014]